MLPDLLQFFVGIGQVQLRHNCVCKLESESKSTVFAMFEVVVFFSTFSLTLHPNVELHV